VSLNKSKTVLSEVRNILCLNNNDCIEVMIGKEKTKINNFNIEIYVNLRYHLFLKLI